MTSTVGRDLGSGVRVVPGDGGDLVVLAESVDFRWRPREDGRPGSVVMIDGDSYEVVERQPWRRGGRWILEPWAGEDVMRVIFTLDDASVAGVAAAARASDTAARLRPWMIGLAPLLGFAASSWQRRWRDAWGFPAATATWTSAVLEMLVGAVGVFELVASSAGGVSVFSWIPRPLVFCGLYLFVEGIVRLAQVFADSEPVGTLLGLVVSTVERPKKPPAQPFHAPDVRLHDRETGSLELGSPIQRRDWEAPGLLPFRGETFAMDGVRRLGESWIYAFSRVDVADDWDGRRLRLAPPHPGPAGPSFEDAPGLVKTVMLTIACTVAPGRFQERWGWQIGVRATWFTAIGAGVELVGGLSNLGSGAGSQPIELMLNLVFVVEALTRLTWVVLRGRPLGSLIGWPLSPLLDRILPE
jgi:hypothetical protein